MANQVQFKDFDDYYSKTTAYWRAQLPNDCSDGKWKYGSCNCPAFMKNYLCKHLIGIAIRGNYCKAPKAIKDVFVGQKKKRGRPAKARKALAIQPKLC